MFKTCCGDCGECWYVGNPRTCTCPDETTKRPWVGLTDREFQPMIQKAMAYYGYDQSEPSHLTAGAGFRVFAYAIEAKLREKNGG